MPDSYLTRSEDHPQEYLFKKTQALFFATNTTIEE